MYSYYYADGRRIAMSVTPSYPGTTTYYYLASDGLGSANVTLDGSGNATASLLYAPYGLTRYSSGTLPTDYGFTGQHSDSTSGLDYYGARYYDPGAAQFTTADTVLPDGGFDIWGLSRYAYVEGNPIARGDPSGHGWDWWNAIKTAVIDTVTVAWQDYQDFQIGVGNTVLSIVETLPPVSLVIEAKNWLDPNSTVRQETGIFLNNGHPSWDSYQRAQNYQIGVEQNQIIQTIQNYQQHPFQFVGTLTVVIATVGLGRAAIGRGAGASDVSLATRGKIGISEPNAGHIFRSGPGHVPDTPANRQLLIETANNPANYVRTDSSGVATYRQMLPDGKQAWAEVYNGQITNGGVNDVPRQ